jgi:hypothetical protein
VTVTIPNGPATSAAKRKPAYLTSYTKGIDLQAVQGGVASGYVFYPLSALQSYCQSAAAGFVCNLALTVPVGNSQIVVNTYDNTAKAGSNILSTGTLAISAAPGAPNAFAVTTNGVAANLNTGNNAAFNCPTLGVPATLTATYTATDADGGTLSGPLGNPVTLQIADPSGSVALGPTSQLTAATGTFTVNYNGGVPTNGVAIGSAIASFTPQGVANAALGTGAITPINASPAGPHYVYVADSTNNLIYVYDVCAQNTLATSISLPGGTNPIDLVYDRYNWNANQSVKHLIAMGANNTLVVVDAATGATLQTVTLPGTPHHMQTSGTDATGDALMVTVDPNKVLRYNVRATSPYLSATATNFTVGNSPRGVNFEGVGNDLFVANSADGTVMAFGTAVDATLRIGVTPDGISGASADRTCALVTDKGNNTVFALKINPAGTSTITQIGSAIPLPGTPQSVGFFPSSNTGIVTTNAGTAVLVTCASGTFAQSGTLTNFISGPTASIPSHYVKPASAPPAVPASFYVVGTNGGQGVLAAYNVGQATPLFGAQFGAGSTPTAVVSGP